MEKIQIKVLKKTFTLGIQTHYAKSQGYFPFARINVRKVLALEWSTFFILPLFNQASQLRTHSYFQ